MSLDVQHQDKLVEWLSEHTPKLMDGAVAYRDAMFRLHDPHVVMRPSVYLDGDQWCAHYGKEFKQGVTARGDSPALACAAFDKAWNKTIQEASETE